MHAGTDLSHLARAACDAALDEVAVGTSPYDRDTDTHRALVREVSAENDRAWAALVAACPGGVGEAQVRATHYARLQQHPTLFGLPRA